LDTWMMIGELFLAAASRQALAVEELFIKNEKTCQLK
jgi:hypothetical protein